MISSTLERPDPRIPSLDGLRALSITAVILGHGVGTRNFPSGFTLAFRNDLVDIANLGVRVFFVISGFLITGLLAEELRRGGSINLRRFFFRRTFRIVPAYAVFLLVVWWLSSLGITKVTSRDLLHALTYTTNYYMHRSWDIGHLWSLAVEEQFYLLWPLAFSISGVGGGKRILMAVVVFVPIWRVLQSTLFPEFRPYIGNSFETTADALALGCLLSLYRDDVLGNVNLKTIVESRWLAPVLFLLGIIGSLRFRPALLVGIPLTNLAIAAMIARSVFVPGGTLGRVLNHPILVGIGTLSYSLYLWQQIFINRQGTGWWTEFPLNFFLAFMVAMISYRLIEKPCLRVRGLIEQRIFVPRPYGGSR